MMTADDEDEEIVVLEDLPPGFIRPDAEIINVDEDSDDTEESLILIDDLREHLNTVLDKWTKSDQGELKDQGYDMIRSWLSLTPEDVKSLSKKSKTKGKDDSENPSSSSYIQLIEQIAALFKKSSKKRNYKKEQIVSRCLDRHADILTMIKEFLDSATSQKRKRESESTLNAPFAKKKATGAEVNVGIADSISGSETDSKRISEEEKLFLDTVAAEVKQMFRRICFVKWSKDWLPVLVLNPYDVPKIEFRDEWKKKYTKYSEQKSNKFMEHLFIWYGCKNDSKAYGWARENELISYEEAKEKGLTVIPKRITEKHNSGKTLTKHELQILDGLFEAEKALEFNVADRFNRHSKEVVEENAEDFGDSKDEEERPPKKKRLQGKTNGTELKSSGDQPVPLKKIKAKPTTTSQSSPKSELSSPTKAVLSVDIDDFLDNEESSKDGGDNEEETKKDEEERPLWAALTRKSTGGRAPRKQLATKAIASKKNTQAASRRVSPASSSKNSQTANPTVSYESTSVAQPRKRSYQEIKKDFEEADAALQQAINEGNKRRIRFFEIAYDVLIEELESIRQN